MNYPQHKKSNTFTVHAAGNAAIISHYQWSDGKVSMEHSDKINGESLLVLISL